MKERSLALRFGLLGLMIALAALLVWLKGIDRGIDLRGGHTVVFRVDLSGVSDREAMLTEVLNTLKERVDPQGLRNLEWRPIGEDRIEVRMPLGSEGAAQAKLAYEQALSDLYAFNIRQQDIRRMANQPPEQQAALIEEKAAGDPQRQALIEQAAAQYQAMQQVAPTTSAPAAGETAAQPAFDPAYLQALAAYNATWDQLRQRNVNTQELTNILDLYVPPRLAKEMKESEVAGRMERLGALLAEYRKRHVPEGAETSVIAQKIDEVVQQYRAWANVRGGLDDPQDLVRLVSRAGVLEYRIAPRTTEMDQAELARYVEQLQTEGPQAGRTANAEYQWFRLRDDPADYRRLNMVVVDWASEPYILLSNRPSDTMLQRTGQQEWSLEQARQTTSNTGLAVGFQFDSAGAQLFAQLTQAHIGDQMAVLLDDEVYSAPVIRSAIYNQGVIEGRFTPDEVRELVRTLSAGSLRARVDKEPVSVSSIGPTLGEENIRRGIRAAYIGLAAVVIFMAAYYLLGGLLADLALALNVLFLLGALALFDATLTLPGIAGVILTMGMAVDANVLIFERLREEQTKAQSLRQSIKNAYDKALSAIVDGNLTTLLTCVILGWIGTQEVRGFAITLGLGILFSMFTAVLVTRWVFQLLDRLGLLKRGIPMLRLIGVPKVNWIGKRYAFWAISGVVIAVGLASLIAQGSDVLGIEFRQGSRAVVRFNDGAMVDGQPLTDSLVAQRFRAAAAQLAEQENLPADEITSYRQMAGQNVSVTVRRDPTRAQSMIPVYDAPAAGGNGNGAIDLSEWTAKEHSADYFRRFDVNQDQQLDAGEIARLPEARYEITTSAYEPQLVRNVINEAFGDLITVQGAVDYELYRGQAVPELGGVVTDPSGITRITDQLAAAVPGEPSNQLRDFRDGALFVFRTTGAQDALTVDDVYARLRTERLASGREVIQMADTLALPLQAAQNEGEFRSFAVAVHSEDVDAGTEAWQTFAMSQLELLEDSLSSERSLESFSNFDPAMSASTSQRAILAVVLSWLVIIAYLWVRFGSATWGLAAVICLIHDSLVVVGMIALSAYLAKVLGFLLIEPFKIDLTMIAAILTVIGYSVNDTIVVFDRIRENRGRLTNINANMINTSINQTLSRTILTTGTTLLVVLVMYIWGGEGIHGFTYALLVGILFGTYSSIAIASPILLGFKKALLAKVAGPVEAEPAGAAATEPTAK